MAGIFTKLHFGLKKTSSKLAQGIADIFSSRKVDEETLSMLEDVLIMADTGVNTAVSLCQDIKKEKFGKDATADEVRLCLKDKVAGLLQKVERPLQIETRHSPFVILMVGVNGSGKTTTCGKLALKLKGQGFKASMAAADTFRAAAKEQLEAWGKKTGVTVYTKATGYDPAGLVYDALHLAKENKDDILLIDTAGRLQNKQSLMAELEKIVRVIKKIDNTAPHSAILVIDAGVGQNALSQVREFKKATDISGIILTKLDGTAKGGIILALAESEGLPIHFIGTGEKETDIETFNANEYAKMMLEVG